MRTSQSVFKIAVMDTTSRKCWTKRHFLVLIRSNVAQASFYTHAHHFNNTLWYRGWWWVCQGFILVPACQQMSQSFSPWACSHPVFAAAHVCPDIYEIGLCELTLLLQQAKCTSHTHNPGDQNVPQNTLHRVLYPSTSRCWPEMAVWEDLVSVWLCQLSFNELLRSVQVPAGQWTDIGSSGNQESLTWRLLLVCIAEAPLLHFPL